jgi:hypothetical protein
MTRKEKLENLLNIAPPLQRDIKAPKAPPRFAALEQDDGGNTLCMYLSASLEGLKSTLAGSDTRFVERVRVHDLDADTVMAPVWIVERFAFVEDKFSYKDGYVTIA